MPDTPTPLDERIRELVTRAVADAPPAPALEDPASLPVGERPVRRRWIAGSAAALAVAAAAVTVVVLADDDGDQTIRTPATQPSAPTSSVVPTPPSTSTTAAPSTTAGEPPRSIGTGQLLAVTGGDHISILNGGGVLLETIDEAADVAFAIGDGRVVFQSQGGASDGLAPADTTPFVWSDGTVVPLALPAEDTDYVEVHDIAVVDDRTLVLWSTFGMDANPATYGDEHLWIAELGDPPTDGGGPYAVGEPTALGVIGGWESGTDRLHLAGTGLIVGTSHDGARHGLFVIAVPGSPAAADVERFTPVAFGLEAGYDDCAGCPSQFTVDSAGRTLAWVDDGGLTRVSLVDDARGVPVTLPFPADRSAIAAVELLDDGAVAVTYADDIEPRRPAVLVRGETVTDLPGLTVTEAPNTGAASPTDPVPTTSAAPTSTLTTAAAPTSTATTAPPGPPPVRLATASADGVTVIEMGEEVRRLEQAAEIALLTPGGAVIFQPARPAPDQPPGDPQIWRGDGSVEPLLADLPAGQWYRLHDLAEIQGVPTLLYGLRTDGPAPTDHTEVITALRMEPGNWTTAAIDEVHTWEGGVSRLSLTDTGLIVGTSSEGVSSSYYAARVPGSPVAGDADGPPNRPPGVEERYAECETCPRDFTASSDGESIVWARNDRIVVFDTLAGTTREWVVPALGADPIRSLDARTASNGGVEVAISFGWPGSEPAPDAVVVATSPPGDVTETPVEARAVTFAP